MAMKIDLENPNPGTTFYFDEADPDGGHIVLRVLNQAKLQEISNTCRIKRVEVKGNPPSRFEILDFKKLRVNNKNIPVQKGIGHKQELEYFLKNVLTINKGISLEESLSASRIILTANEMLEGS